MEMPKEATGGAGNPKGFRTVNDLIAEGKSAPPLEPLRWEKGQGARQTAFLCYSSGTSGLPKGVMISHRNVIANTMQICEYVGPGRRKMHGNDWQENVLGLLPFSHIYGLVVNAHSTLYEGDGVVVLPKFEMASFLQAIQDYKLSKLYLVSKHWFQTSSCAQRRGTAPTRVHKAYTTSYCRSHQSL